MRTFALFHQLAHHRLRSSQLPALYSIFTVRALLFTFLSVFLPIFYYQKFTAYFSLQSQVLSAVFLSFAAMHFVHIFAGYAAGKIAYRFGVRISLMIASILLLLYVVAVGFFDGIGVIFVSIITLGLHFGFWWHTTHLMMLHSDRQNHFGRDIGLLEGIGILVGLVTPAVAGSIAQTYGFQGLFSGSILVAVALITLISFLRFTYLAQPITLKSSWNEIKAHKGEFVAFMGAGMEIAVLENIWPLLLFILFQKLIVVGAAASLIALVGFTFALIAGRLTDKLPKDKLQRIGSLCVAITWTGKLMWPSPLGAIIWDSWHRTLGAFFYIPLTVISYLGAMQKNDNSYFFMRELGYNSSKTVMMLLCAVLVWQGISLWWLLVFGIVGPLLSLTVLRIPKAAKNSSIA